MKTQKYVNKELVYAIVPGDSVATQKIKVDKSLSIKFGMHPSASFNVPGVATKIKHFVPKIMGIFAIELHLRNYDMVSGATLKM